jgi:hypothetical protein
MKRSELKRKTPMKRMAIRVKRDVAELSVKCSPRLRTMKSKERAVTKEEKRLWSRMVAAVGCIACYMDGHAGDYVSIHHIDGRTKPECHKKVLPLCAGHHQKGTGNDKELIAVHPDKARFEARYGAQLILLQLILAMINKDGE